jgi:hypothetical protein
VRKLSTSPPAPRAAPAGADGRLDLSRLVLLGVVSAETAPRALLRLPSGEILRVSAGDRVGPWRVERVGMDGVRLAASGRTPKLLRLP